ncbi:MAG: hypothetical protein AAGF85_02660 [Bacteroidota bacterium]
MIRKWVLMIYGCAMLGNTLAQPGKVWLKNGSLIYGHVQLLDSGNLELLVDESVLKLPVDKVRTIALRRMKYLGASETIDRSAYENLSRLNKRGLEKSIQIGLLHGRENSEASTSETISLSLNASYRFNQFVQPGLSVGYDHHDEFAIFPVQFIYRADISARWSSPFIYGGIGYGFAKLLEEEDADISIGDASGGLNTQLGLGYRWRVEKIGFEFAVGWKHKKVDFDYKNFDWFWTQNENNITLQRSINRAEFKLGIIF